MSSVSEPADPRYPIGRFVAPDSITLADIRYAILSLSELPEQLREALRGLNEDQLNTPYRDSGWTVRQLVHHIADSHSVALHRIKRILTENDPEIPGYDEKAFAMLPDTHAPVEWSLELVESVHARWVLLLQGLGEAQFARTYRHSERGPSDLRKTVLLYAWHGRHHVARLDPPRRENQDDGHDEERQAHEAGQQDGDLCQAVGTQAEQHGQPPAEEGGRPEGRR